MARAGFTQGGSGRRGFMPREAAWRQPTHGLLWPQEMLTAKKSKLLAFAFSSDKCLGRAWGTRRATAGRQWQVSSVNPVRSSLQAAPQPCRSGRWPASPSDKCHVPRRWTHAGAQAGPAKRRGGFRRVAPVASVRWRGGRVGADPPHGRRAPGRRMALTIFLYPIGPIRAIPAWTGKHHGLQFKAVGRPQPCGPWWISSAWWKPRTHRPSSATPAWRASRRRRPEGTPNGRGRAARFRPPACPARRTARR